MRSPLTEVPIATADGVFVAHYSEKGLAEIDWPKAGRAELPLGQAARQHRPTKAIPAKIQSWHKLTSAALKNILAGRNAKELPPLDWNGKTEFQKSVWRVMLKIPAGKTKSYGEVAAAIGRPKAVRAVGGACGANPIPVLVPCHRILAANKKIGGFSGGLERKRALLAREGVKV
jgi:methylated-DNA-[protein]-cysteine S-methyltransferase